ncbi:uncharacterized protein N7511_009540 [Penicillium nucicola]|uniref:uncharacterized protein n=1 Tax=Penicillium nucicola TaxID=1850975 RepID=UPI00254530C0|nr:uncharacterized protein N7511_009540 [Penicillium nucicola]KAJ5747844.1 hypothetical protein N7511_009540 [Penicillium nucicola]
MRLFSQAEENAAQLYDSCWHRLCYAFDGDKLFDCFRTLDGGPHAAARRPSDFNRLTWDTPLRLAIQSNRPDLVERFCHYYPPPGYVLYTPGGETDLDFAVRCQKPNSPECLYHMLSMPTLRVWMASTYGNPDYAIMKIAELVFSWYTVLEDALNNVPQTPHNMVRFAPAMAELRQLANRKMCAVLSHSRPQSFQDQVTARSWRRVRRLGGSTNRRFLQQLIRPGVAFHATRTVGR